MIFLILLETVQIINLTILKIILLKSSIQDLHFLVLVIIFHREKK